MPTQISGAVFLADRQFALLADSPRVGKTGASILAADDILAQNILVITTASGRGVWKSGLEAWTSYPRNVQLATSSTDNIRKDTEIAVVGWGGITQPALRAQLLRRKWDLIIADEAHAAKSFEAKRTQALYGELQGDTLYRGTALINNTERIWLLTGTPIPNSPLDIYPMMRALCPERLTADEARGWPEVLHHDQFLDRYCKWRPHKISQWKSVKVVLEGKNLAELRARLDGFFLQRTQADVGITEPDYELMPIVVSDRLRRECEGDISREAVLAAADSGDSRSLEMHLGPLRRLTGEIIAKAVVAAVKEELDLGLDRIVLAYWHKDVAVLLAEALSRYGVTGIDGSASAKEREEAVRSFLMGDKRIFLAQIQAAGEAIDLSAAHQLWFVESTFSPAQMKQCALRITNKTQARQPLVRVCVLQGSIYEALQAVLLRKVTTIKEIMGK